MKKPSTSLSLPPPRMTPLSALASLRGADGLLAAVLQCPLSQAGAPSQLLDEATTACVAAGDARSWPARLAAELHARLGAAAGGRFGWGFFAAVAATPARIVVCHAGDLRVHLFADGRFVEVTRDHVVANESAAWLAATYGDTDLSMHQSMVTGALGQEPLRAEVTEWAAPSTGEVTLFVCDAELHRHRAPDSYVAEALAPTATTSGLALWLVQAFGGASVDR